MAEYRKFVKWIPYSKSYYQKPPRLFYNNVHYCSWCGCIMPKEKYHGNCVFCNYCQTKWDVGNKNNPHYVIKYRDQSYETDGDKDAITYDI